jgi:signal transduction histidine kinase
MDEIDEGNLMEEVVEQSASSLPAFPAAYRAAREHVEDRRRLSALHATGLLDSEVEEAFDRLTRLAVRLVKIPAAFVSMVDQHRDFYKSACGFGEPLASTRQLEGPTFCHFTVQSARPLIIPDTVADPVYRDVPTVKSLGVAAYVGIPILVNGQVIGAMCAIDVVPHAWTDAEVGTLQELAAVAVSEISLRMSRAEAERLRQTAEQMVEESAATQLELELQARELERARVAAEAANQAKSDFLAGMSHDLRTPLNAIGGYAQLIEMGVHGPVTDAQRDAAVRITLAQKHLLTLIDDILQFAKSESGQMAFNLRPVPLAEICAALDSLVRQQAEAKGLSFRCELDKADGRHGVDLTVVADVDRVLQILVNLAANAIKFTQAGGSITVSGSRSGEWAQLTVRDTGRGIAAENLETIFQPFVQVGHSSPGGEGIGLGLATSRTLARRMGGDISVTSIVDAGSAFTLMLPLA